MPAYVIVNVNTRDPERYERYKQMAQDTVAHLGGRYLRQSLSTTDLVIVDGYG